MKSLVIALALAGFGTLGGCGGCGSDAVNYDAGVSGDAPVAFTACGGAPDAFVRQTFLALDGRRPRSQAEVNVYTDLYAAAVTKGLDPKATVARAIMAEPEFSERWVQQTMDAMQVQRFAYQTEAECWDRGTRWTATAALAAAVRDQAATGTGDGAQWNMADLAVSAIALDDLTPLYRAQLFSMMQHPIPAANVADVAAELARRADFGATFDSGYLHRDAVCLDCHNSSFSVTDRNDPATDRFWPVPGLAEMPVYGTFTHVTIAAAHAPFRVDSFVGTGASRPWGWASSCGRFATSVPPDPAGVTAKLASIGGQQSTVYTLEAALKHGFDQLRGQLPAIGSDGMIADPDQALAWLVTLKMTEDVWTKVTGTRLTIANYYPRNKAASDLLYMLAQRSTQSGYSLQALLVAIVGSDYFNRKPAEAACGAGPYTYPSVFDPWVIADPDPAKRLNGPGDAVQAVDARTLVSALAGALDWSPPPLASRFPDYGCSESSSCQAIQQACQQEAACCTAYQASCQMSGVSPTTEVPFQRGVGMFLRNSERGFRGLDFQARLVWENHENVCARPAWVARDFIDTLAAESAADPTATTRDVVAALKDRLMGEPAISVASEIDALTAITGSLDGPASGVTAATLRELCGAFVNTPQFLLAGIAGRGGEVPKLTPAKAGYAAICIDVASHVPGAVCPSNGGALALP